MPGDRPGSMFPSGITKLELSKLHKNNENICLKADPKVILKHISRKIRILAVGFLSSEKSQWPLQNTSEASGSLWLELGFNKVELWTDSNSAVGKQITEGNSSSEKDE